MSYRTLRSLFHDPSEDEAAIYDSRFSDPRTIHLETAIKGFPAFIFMTPEIYENLIEASRLDKEILKLELALPERALTNYRNSCLIDEIVITNEIEGVNSTRREIGQVLERLEKNDASSASFRSMRSFKRGPTFRLKRAATCGRSTTTLCLTR